MSALFDAYNALRKASKALKRALWNVTPQGVSRSANDHLLLVHLNEGGQAEVTTAYPNGQSKTYA
jgi:hypothetical protein